MPSPTAMRRDTRPKLIKKIISITPQQNAYLDRISAELGTSIADIVRRALDDWRLTRPAASPAPAPEPPAKPRASRKPRS